MSWILTKEFRFEASHILPMHSGKCGRLHGHSWTGVAYVKGESLNQEGSSSGMVLDYADIKKHINPLVEESLDHWHLNESTGLENPTSEEIARWIYKRLEPLIPGLLAVRVDETCTSSCLYSEVGFNEIQILT